MEAGTATGAAIDGSTRLVRPIQALLQIASAARIFRSADGGLLVRVPVGDRREVFSLRSRGFREWLIDGYFAAWSAPPKMSAISGVISVLEARARFDAGVPSVSIRVARGSPESRSGFFIDLGDSTEATIEVTERGWQVVDRPDAFFWRPKGMAALPVPSRDGSIDLLRRYVNVREDGFRLLIAWLTAALLPEGPYPILALHGEQGSAKTSLAKVIRLLMDPQDCAHLVKPTNIRDLMVTAANSRLLVYDNLSVMPGWLSDGLCGIVYGTGFASRAHFSHSDCNIIQAHCPVILNGIEEFVVKSDLADRTVFLHLSPIYQSNRRGEQEFWDSFRAEHPRILGGVLDAIVGGLRELPSVNLTRLPRMADFARWGEAIGRGLGWHEGEFTTVYGNNRLEATESAIDGSAVGTAVLAFAQEMMDWQCSPTELLEILAERAGKKVAKSARWPKSIPLFTNELRRLAPQLRMRGVGVEFGRNRAGRIVRVTSCGALAFLGSGQGASE
jgi:hypothetical protein